MPAFGEDIDLRRKYAQQHRECQLSSLLFSFGEIPTAHAKAAETHHIFGGVARVDNWSNLIRISSEAHRWCHENGRRSQVACLYQKIAVSRLWLPEVQEACRTHQVVGWLESAMSQFEDDPLVTFCGRPVLAHLRRQTVRNALRGMDARPTEQRSPVPD